MRTRRTASRLPRQAPRRAAGDAACGGAAARAVHHRHPDRHRRDRRGTHRHAAGDPRRPRRATATCRKSSSRISAPSRTRGWRRRRMPRTRTMCATIALARLVLPPEVSIQAPPNLSPGRLEALIAAGIDDWGGVSPVTIDHVNPEAPWPTLAELEARTRAAGKVLAAAPAHPSPLRRGTRNLGRSGAAPPSARARRRRRAGTRRLDVRDTATARPQSPRRTSRPAASPPRSRAPATGCC